MRLIALDQIKKTLQNVNLLPVIADGFIAYSEGRAVIPPVGELLFSDPPGDVHIKYGYLAGGAYYVIKIASGFYNNPALGLPSSNGVMLLFDQKTGEPLCLLQDEGYLTDLRTAVAGALAAQALAPKKVERIGILGTGTQARLQLRLLPYATDCRSVLVWGRNAHNLSRYKHDMEAEGFVVETTQQASAVGASCNLIVTTTPARSPLLEAADIRPGTHVTAMGSDTPEKQELAAEILGNADLVVADSIAQCLQRGEIYHAIRARTIAQDALVELGQVLSGAVPGRTSETQITIADLTGVAVQDLQIAQAVYEGG